MVVELSWVYLSQSFESGEVLSDEIVDATVDPHLQVCIEELESLLHVVLARQQELVQEGRIQETRVLDTQVGRNVSHHEVEFPLLLVIEVRQLGSVLSKNLPMEGCRMNWIHDCL